MSKKTKSQIVLITLVTITILYIILCSICLSRAQAQKVTRVGKIFVQDSTSHKFKKQSVTLTKYYYMTTDGTKYPIYMSQSGKCFIIRKSKNGREYKQYLPEITKQIKNNEN